MGEIGIHLEQAVVPPLEPPPEPGQVGSSQPLLGRSMQNLDAGIGPGKLIRHGPGTVGRVVVHDEHFEPLVLGEYMRKDGGQVFLLVIGGQYDKKALSHRSGSLCVDGPTPHRTVRQPRAGRSG